MFGQEEIAANSILRKSISPVSPLGDVCLKTCARYYIPVPPSGGSAKRPAGKRVTPVPSPNAARSLLCRVCADHAMNRTEGDACCGDMAFIRLLARFPRLVVLILYLLT
jgi:hypothetical protein